MEPAMTLALAASFGSAERWREEFAAMGKAHDGGSGWVLLDVHRAGVFEQATAMIPGATWRDPSAVEQWASELPAGRGVVVYCVYGHEVGRSTALRLRAMGLDARYLRGGFDGWQAAGRPVEAKLPRPSR
ncbi:hypothetical protein GOQ09_04895 [Variovorax paradoxus]|uniref:Rhodanese domain-containing protein n=2 Tax=Variovorax paradoxus TaxID=34073 RepID=A0A6I6HQM8_VARPD|nr:hypothetical protein GOQ09_04895 [Variovorax paradoxus]